MSAQQLSPLYRKIALRLVPFLMLLYMIAFLDRVNIGFAALTMNRDLGISDSLYGFAAGIFFVGYCLFEVPANLMLVRVGARRWLALLMIGWGIVSVGTAFVDSRTQYIVARSLLGVAEAGFFPGIIFYLTFWLPRSVRTRLMALFLLSLPICNAIGSPISSHLLELNGIAGLRGWQWLFILEGAPSVLLGAVAWFALADGPDSSRWLSPAEKADLSSQMRADEADESRPAAKISLHIVRDCAAYFLLMNGVYSLSFWLPKILSSGGITVTATGWWTALPYALGALGMIVATRMKAAWWLAVLCLVSGAGFAGAALNAGFAVSVASFGIATMALYASLPLFWSVSTARMSSKAAGAAIATVNSVGLIGGFTGPYAMGWLRDLTHSYSAGLWGVAACLALGAVFMQRRDPKVASAAELQ